MNNSREALLRQRTSLIAYLTAKVAAEDWHACQDAASDIREIDAKLQLLASLGNEGASREPQFDSRLGR